MSNHFVKVFQWYRDGVAGPVASFREEFHFLNDGTLVKNERPIGTWSWSPQLNRLIIVTNGDAGPLLAHSDVNENYKQWILQQVLQNEPVEGSQL